MRAARSLVVALPLVLLLAACAPEPAATSGSGSSSATASARPAPSPTAEATTDAPAPAPAPVDPGFTDAELIALCIAETQALAPSATYQPERATIEWLGEAGLWFVVVPKTLDGAPSVAVCGIGGTAAQPDVQVSGETLPGGEADMRAQMIDGHEHQD